MARETPASPSPKARTAPGDARINFVHQQGFRDATAQECPLRYPALMFQPRLVLGLVVLGILLQDAWYWTALGGVLCGSAAFPRLNPFDAIWNAVFAGPEGRRRLPPAPPPRRFAQGLGGGLALVVATSLSTGWPSVTWALQGFLLLAASALVFGRFCFGSWLFLHLRGEHRYAQRTTPWGEGDPCVR